MRRPLKSVLLRHSLSHETHHDWMLEAPEDPAGRLWTARLRLPWAFWQGQGWDASRAGASSVGGGSWLLQELPTHRRIYLQYQGPIGGGRGSVLQLDHGIYRPLIWTASRRLVELNMQRVFGRFEMVKLGGTTWRLWIVRSRVNRHENLTHL
jgi:hypothetical protein